ncbi:P-loop containing nucleoside triphosphate hydrolase protein [Mariannaea sp. PMI_226]|nr:P-loop containing nucleoside triphosphate hydrolase protein [Mariannaea sp. PMI_226]
MSSTTSGDTTPNSTSRHCDSFVTKLYKQSCRHCQESERWSKFQDSITEEEDLNFTIASDPIIHRLIEKRGKWFTESFTIHSPYMKAHIRTCLEKYQDFDPDLAGWTFRPPYNPLVHRWNRLTNTLDAEGQEPDADVSQAIQELIKFLQPILLTSIRALALTKDTGEIIFEDIWQIFSPCELVMTTFYGVEAVCRVVRYERLQQFDLTPYWKLDLEYIDWNGKICGYQTTSVNILCFAGKKYVKSLPAYPLNFHPSAKEVKERIIERGRAWEQLRGYHFRSYDGTKVLLRPLEKSEAEAPRLLIGSRAKGSDNDEEDSIGKSVIKPSERCEVMDSLTDTQCLLATPWVIGMDLKKKDWARFQVENLVPIIWNDEAFDHLVLPGNEKELAWEFVENKAICGDSFDDFVEDKGRGIIILMFGPPGVGKTYTAEAVAERARVPLYNISAATLGTDPSDVEEALDGALELCKLWNAMLLLDEADVFLGARSNADLDRNELVAVFLTKLEYYQGICFMTTNRAGSLDHAIQSRVDLFLRYSNLSTTARRLVWKNFLAKAGGRNKFSLSDDDVLTLADYNLNGREIRNMVKTAHLLSVKSEDGKIGLERFVMLIHNRLEALMFLAKQQETRGNSIGLELVD